MLELDIIKQHVRLEPDFVEDDALLDTYSTAAQRLIENHTGRTLYATAGEIPTETDPDTGEILEGATSTVVAVKGEKLRTAAGRGILPGTTQAALFAHAKEKGYRCKAKPLTVEYLEKADSVWLVSSVRVAARVTRLNDKKLKAPDNVDVIRDLIDKALGD